MGNEQPRSAKGPDPASGKGARSAWGSSPIELGRVGRYRLLTKLETTSTATVYVGCDAGSASRQLVIKVLHAHLFNETTSVEAFLDEARIASRLAHSCAARVVDFGRDTSACFIASEYTPSETLKHFGDAAREHWDKCSREEGFDSMPVILKGGGGEDSDRPRAPSSDPSGLSWSDADAYTSRCLRLARDICEGLHVAHQLRDDGGRPLGVIAADLSPDTVRVRLDGSIQLEGFTLPRPQTAAHDAATGVIPAR
ncbi:MAG TPA: hypothetical protein VGL13_04925, partial [Polyangiaceae bacterium]